jgi:membrane-associated protease RseP (regulator of RpoE activity)
MTRAFLRAVGFAGSVALATVAIDARAGESGSAPAPALPTPPPPSAPPSAPLVPVGIPAAPWLGVQMDAGSDIGVTVEHVVRGSPAEKAGVRQGDRLVSVDGTKTTAAAQVTRAVGQRKVGDSIAVDLERRGTAVTVTVTLAVRPGGDDILKMDLVGAPAPVWTKVSALAGAPSSPRLSALKEKFGAQGLTVVGITTDEAEKAAVFAEKHQMRYGIVVDKDGDTSRAYGVSALPTMLLVDKKGVVRDVFIGYDPSGDARLEASLKALLAETAPPPTPVPPPTPAAPRPPAR